jgi:hypothetical protein
LGELRVPAGKHFGQQNDLPGVMGEVFGNVEDSFDTGHVKPLDGVSAFQVLKREIVQDVARFAHRLSEAAD